MPQDREKRPSWTMDVMILANLSEIGKYIDDSAMKVKAGNLEFLSEWRAALDQFYTNIRSFLNEDVKNVANETFFHIENNFPLGSKAIPEKVDVVRAIIQKLQILNEMFYQARNEIFMRFIEIMTPREKATNYAYSALPKAVRDQRIDDAIKKDEEDATTENNS